MQKGNNDMRQIENDDALLKQFFGQHAETIADDGFSKRVMAALPRRADIHLTENLRLRRWSLTLDIAALVAALALLIGMGFFGSVQDHLLMFVQRVVTSLLAFDDDAILEQLMLFLHRLPAAIPSSTQALALLLTSLILLPLSIRETAKTA